ncbi:S9 family peptidase [Salinibacterium sp. ZJ450]|uniref:alpha/beta hydrolase family protein n=1 Tax=Salinibacterium sp. ZJ450 TaxID=2708338 RepID=UPI001421E5AA|nr:S9 family peptidase [Salinibacterium sp. ZJ450]
MKFSDLPLLQSVSAPTIHPSGDRAVVSVTRPNLEADAYVGQLWEVLLSGVPTARRFTRGFRDTAPQFSPNGRLLAFIRSAPDVAGQLHIVDSLGGEPTTLTEAPLGVIGFRWSPDGTRIAFTARVPEAGRYRTIEGLGPDAEPARRITSTRYKANGVGYTTDRRSQVFLLEVPRADGEPVYPVAPSVDNPKPDRRSGVPKARQLTTGDFDHGDLSFSADGGSLLVVSARHERRDRDLRTDLWHITLGKPGSRARVHAELVTGTEPNRAIRLVEQTASGAILFIAHELGRGGRDFVARHDGLFIIDRPGAPARRLTEAESIDLGDCSAVVVVDDETFLVQNRTRGALHLTAVTAGGQVTALTAGPFEVHGAAAASDTIALSLSAANTVGDVAVLRGGQLQLRTDFSGELRSAGLRPARELVVPARDGHAVHGWVLQPAGDGPHPVLLMVHGGPFSSHTVTVLDEAQVYADAGYAVVMCNPRGSSGYGQRHGRVIRRGFGTLDFTDVIDFLDGALSEFPALDADRLGVMGGSYGGYLTAWITEHDQRFAAAIVERGFLDATAFAGNSDIGTFFGQEYLGTSPDAVRAQNAQEHVQRVNTPTLLIHSEQDLRCPLDQAERYYQALRRQGVDAELVLFPGEDHELSRSGRPRHRRQRFEIILDWWERHLPVTPVPPTTPV